MTPEEAQRFWDSLTPEQRDRMAEALRPLMAHVKRLCDHYDRLVTAAGEDLADAAEDWANLPRWNA